MAAAIIGCSFDRRCLPVGGTFLPIFGHEGVHCGRAPDALAGGRWIMTDADMRNHPPCDHHCLMPGEDRGGADGDGAHAACHAELDDIDIPAAWIMADAKAMLDPEPCRGARLALGFARNARIGTDFGKRLFHDLFERETGQDESPKVSARPPDTRCAASAMMSSARWA